MKMGQDSNNREQYLTVKQFTWLVLHHRLMDTIDTLLEEEGIRHVFWSRPNIPRCVPYRSRPVATLLQSVPVLFFT